MITTLFSFGNCKVGKDTAIFNITSAKNCMTEKLGLCSIADKCYAKKAEWLYKNSLPYRDRQTEFFDSTNAMTFVTYFKSVTQNRCNKLKYLRFSESGDFRDQSDIDKVSEISELLNGYVKVYTYTARKDLVFSNVSKNLVINGSGFMLSNNFYIYRNTDEIIDRFICQGFCLTCNFCKEEKYRNIAVKLH